MQPIWKLGTIDKTTGAQSLNGVYVVWNKFSKKKIVALLVYHRKTMSLSITFEQNFIDTEHLINALCVNDVVTRHSVTPKALNALIYHMFLKFR